MQCVPEFKIIFKQTKNKQNLILSKVYFFIQNNQSIVSHYLASIYKPASYQKYQERCLVRVKRLSNDGVTLFIPVV